MNVVDSSGWIEYFAEGPNAGFFAPPIEALAELAVPTVSLYEVFKHLFLQRGEMPALQAVATMRRGRVIELTSALALAAARISLGERLPMADSIMLATARACGAKLWSQDSDFERFDEVGYVAKKPAN